MNNVILIATICTLVSMFFIFVSYLFEGGKVTSDIKGCIEVTLYLSIPLILSFIGVVLFCRNDFEFAQSFLSTASLFIFSFVALLYIAWNGIMFIDALRKRTVGPEHGYGGIILFLGSIKAAFIGCVISLIVYLVNWAVS